jgi:hypothetical protein
MKLSLYLTGLLAGVSLFVGCGGSSSSGSSQPQLRTGILTDSPIVGADYSCGDIKGTTNKKGEFSCKVAPITFKVGGLLLGEVKAFTADNKVYPQDLVGVARSDFTNPKLVGLTRLLQSLDDDGDITTAINIPASRKAKFAPDLGANTDWAGLAGLAGVTLVSDTDAISHLQGMMGGNATKDESGGEQGDSQQQGSTLPNVGDWSPVTTNFTCDPAPMTLGTMHIDSRYASEGGISVSCITQGGITTAQYKLTPMTITQLQKVEESFGEVNGIRYTSHETHDFKAGTVHIQEHGSNGYSIDCVETYASLLPKEIYVDTDLEDLMEFSPAKSMLQHTTCPSSYYDDGDSSDDGKPDKFQGSLTERANYTFTDSKNKVHKVSTQTKGSTK